MPEAIAEVNLLPVPDGLASEVAAMVEPLACCLRGVERAGVEAGDRVAILGAGPIGLMLAACVADAGGRAEIVGGRPERRALAPLFGAEAGDGERADVVIEAAGTAGAWAQALGLVRPGGTVVYFGGRERDAVLSVDAYRLHYEELTLRGAFHHAPRHVRAALAFLRAARSRGAGSSRTASASTASRSSSPTRPAITSRPLSFRERELVFLRQPKSVSSGSRSPRRTARSTSTQAIPRDSARVTACCLKDCAARMPRQRSLAGSARMKPR